MPAWRCIGDQRWELTFHTVEGTTNERPAAVALEQNAETIKDVRRRTTGIKVKGLAPK